MGSEPRRLAAQILRHYVRRHEFIPGSINGKDAMKKTEVRANAFAMPLHDPAYPKPPYKFYNREFVVINYRTDPMCCVL